ncbi:glycosyltransferase family 2 protein [Mucilaginibacter sp. X4EP1]|uniref:glycosyltransferase family 2 protein n=1 Tax=Mucilaginibacter sp. X4EP1 TaxID=2723092 RepID=UPI002167AEB7|nr:glycosyltransferase family 2 protein [Mucilaginibacter sp. X4EP1]MCS3811708.1 glycosyltransferase involved in cell wall biosynthesis [Mucilaginibacter sp. X4EP1]
MDVSVIIPAYNRLWCLPRAIESCRNTVCKTEIIVVDDGSTDGTWEWLQGQADIISVKQENQGQTYAINKGFSVARGQYIRFLDSDDFLTTGIIDAQYQSAINGNAQLVCSRVDNYKQSTGEITICPEITHWEDFLEIQLSNTYGSHFLGMLFHRSLVEKTPRRPDFAFREDRMFLLEIALLNPKMELVEGCAGYWVQHDQQMQGNYSGLQSQTVNWQHLKIYQRILGKLEAEGRLLPQYKKAACTILWPLAHWIAKNHIQAANSVVQWINELDPEFVIPDAGITGLMYRKLGFTFTERLLKLRRFFKYGWE